MKIKSLLALVLILLISSCASSRKKNATNAMNDYIDERTGNTDWKYIKNKGGSDYFSKINEFEFYASLKVEKGLTIKVKGSQCLEELEILSEKVKECEGYGKFKPYGFNNGYASAAGASVKPNHNRYQCYGSLLNLIGMPQKSKIQGAVFMEIKHHFKCFIPRILKKHTLVETELQSYEKKYEYYKKSLAIKEKQEKSEKYWNSKKGMNEKYCSYYYEEKSYLYSKKLMKKYGPTTFIKAISQSKQQRDLDKFINRRMKGLDSIRKAKRYYSEALRANFGVRANCPTKKLRLCEFGKCELVNL